jgi:hypothetical protein
MPVYTVHAPPSNGAEETPASDRFVFVRDGFYVWAFIASLLWLVYHRLWLTLLGYIGLTIAVSSAMALLHVDAGARMLVLILISLLLGFEAGSLWRWTLQRRGYRQLDLVVADNAVAAERRFFDRWSVAPIAGYAAPIDRGSPPPARPPSSPRSDILGLFPGASR